MHVNYKESARKESVACGCKWHVERIMVKLEIGGQVRTWLEKGNMRDIKGKSEVETETL